MIVIAAGVQRLQGKTKVPDEMHVRNLFLFIGKKKEKSGTGGREPVPFFRNRKGTADIEGRKPVLFFGNRKGTGRYSGQRACSFFREQKRNRLILRAESLFLFQEPNRNRLILGREPVPFFENITPFHQVGMLCVSKRKKKIKSLPKGCQSALILLKMPGIDSLQNFTSILIPEKNLNSNFFE